jgi:hypothetical protein
MIKFRSRSKEERQIVRELTSAGWRRMGRNGQNHERMQWPASGRRLIIPGCGPEHFYVKVRMAARKIEAESSRESGVSS